MHGPVILFSQKAHEEKYFLTLGTPEHCSDPKKNRLLSCFAQHFGFAPTTLTGQA